MKLAGMRSGEYRYFLFVNDDALYVRVCAYSSDGLLCEDVMRDYLGYILDTVHIMEYLRVYPI
jgi:predicted DNA-binding transcriptional regulator